MDSPQPIPNSAPASGAAEAKAASSKKEQPPVTASAPDSPAPPAATQIRDGPPKTQTPPSSPAPEDDKLTNVSNLSGSAAPSMLRNKTPQPQPPVTLATPDLAQRSKEVRSMTVARGNDDSVFSTGPSTPGNAPGNSALSFDAPIAAPLVAKAQPAAVRFPGNVDPADYLPTEEFANVVTRVGSVEAKLANGGTAKPVTINVMNNRGLIPGNLPPELGDILQLVNAINAAPVKNLDLRVYPGNVPPDSASGAGTPTVLEFSPGNSADKKDVKSVQMQLMPGNVPPELGDMLDFLGGIGPQVGA
jgi:hypothetical protein